MTVLAACASRHVLTGTPRPPIDPSQVRVYFAPPPSGYEEIALLESNSGAFTYGEQNKMNSVIGKLRVEAAKLGANGVLFQGTEDGYGGSGIERRRRRRPCQRRRQQLQQRRRRREHQPAAEVRARRGGLCRRIRRRSRPHATRRPRN